MVSLHALGLIREIVSAISVENWHVVLGNLLFRHFVVTQVFSRSWGSRHHTLMRLYAYVYHRYDPYEIVSWYDANVISSILYDPDDAGVNLHPGFFGV